MLMLLGLGLLCASWSSSPPLALAFAVRPVSSAAAAASAASSSFALRSAVPAVGEADSAAVSSSSSSTTTSHQQTKVIATDAAFLKPQPDDRQYRAITLPNGLTVLLVSDPSTDVEAGSVHINSGHFQDPPHRPGLAHFHEHMLFLGTAKYPGENDFEQYLGRNGGSSNAFTDMVSTCMDVCFDVMFPLRDQKISFVAACGIFVSDFPTSMCI